MSDIPRPSHHFLWLLSVPLLTLGLWPEWQDFFSLWYDSIVYNHGYLVLAGTLFLLYHRREALGNLRIDGSPVALILLAGASVTLLFSQAADIRAVRLLLVPILILLWGWSIWGTAFLRTAAGPILLLLFAVPVWDDFSPVLQHITVFFNEIFLQLAGIEATINEFLITLEVGAFIVEDGCSGVRYLMVALFLAAFYGLLYYRSYRSTALLIIGAALLSMLANWIRVFGVIVAGHYTNMETSLVDDHEVFGWVIFIIFTLMPLLFLSGRLEKSTSEQSLIETPKVPVAGSTKSVRHTSLGWPLAASVLILWPPLVPLALDAKIQRVGISWQPELISAGSSWRGPLRHADFWSPDFSSPDIELSGVYVSSNHDQVQLQLTGYRNQTQNKELIFYGNKLFDDALWDLVSTDKQRTGNDTGLAPVIVNEVVIESKNNEVTLIVWSWYDVGGYVTASKLEAKLAGAFKKLTGDSRGALWAMAGRCEASGDNRCDQQRAAFKQFLADAPAASQ